MGVPKSRKKYFSEAPSRPFQNVGQQLGFFAARSTRCRPLFVPPVGREPVCPASFGGRYIHKDTIFFCQSQEQNANF
jgi:hypothetical protein